MWLVVVHFTCLTISSVPHYCTGSTFHHLSQFVLKTELSCYVSVENRMWKYGQGFIRLAFVESKHQSDEHDQAGADDFQHLIWIFWVCRLSPVWYNIDCSQLMSQFDRCQLQLVYLTMEHSSSKKPLAWNFTNYFWYVQSVTEPSPYTAQIFFYISVAFLPFLK